MKYKGEMWHLNKILESMNQPRTQMEICRRSQISNYKLRPYLRKLVKLKFIKKVENYNRNAMAIVWKITSKGRDFNKVIARYVSFGFDLKVAKK